MSILFNGFVSCQAKIAIGRCFLFVSFTDCGKSVADAIHALIECVSITSAVPSSSGVAVSRCGHAFYRKPSTRLSSESFQSAFVCGAHHLANERKASAREGFAPIIVRYIILTMFYDRSDSVRRASAARNAVETCDEDFSGPLFWPPRRPQRSTLSTALSFSFLFLFEMGFLSVEDKFLQSVSSLYVYVNVRRDQDKKGQTVFKHRNKTKPKKKKHNDADAEAIKLDHKIETISCFFCVANVSFSGADFIVATSIQNENDTDTCAVCIARPRTSSRCTLRMMENASPQSRWTILSRIIHSLCARHVSAEIRWTHSG